MRPVNLIPPEERRGERGPSRTGVLPYVVLGALVLGVLAISAVTLTSNQISDRETELASLEAEEQVTRARAESLRPYADFATLEGARTSTVTSLAQSRFDWERVLRELALVLPDDVWLIELTGTVSPGVTLESGADLTIRDSVAGPALSIVGCGESHEAVAGFVGALEDIDGVTRVGVAKSERSTDSSTGAGPGGDDCRTRDFISRFEIVAAFDAVPVPAAAGEAPVPVTPGATPAPAGTTAQNTDPEAAEATAASQASRDSADEQTDKARRAANIVPGVAR